MYKQGKYIFNKRQDLYRVGQKEFYNDALQSNCKITIIEWQPTSPHNSTTGSQLATRWIKNENIDTHLIVAPFPQEIETRKHVQRSNKFPYLISVHEYTTE